MMSDLEYVQHSWAKKRSSVEEVMGSEGGPGTVRFECKLEPHPQMDLKQDEQEDLLVKLRQTALDAMRKFVTLKPVMPLVDKVEMQKNRLKFFKTGKILTPAELSQMSGLLEKYFKSCFDTQRLHYDNQDRSAHKINLVHVRFLTSPVLAFKFALVPEPKLTKQSAQVSRQNSQLTPCPTRPRPK